MCNCKRTDQPKSVNDSPIVRKQLDNYWNANIKGKSFEDITYEEMQTLNMFFHDIFPLNKSTDGIYRYNKLKNFGNYE